MGLLNHDEILKLHEAVVSARLVESRVALLAGIDAELVAGLPHTANSSDQILCDLDALNAVGALADHSVPLAAWAANAAALAGARKEAAIFRSALERCRAPSAPPAAPSKNANGALPEKPGRVHVDDPSGARGAGYTRAVGTIPRAADDHVVSARTGERLLALEASSRDMSQILEMFSRLNGYRLPEAYRIERLCQLGSQFAVFEGRHLATGEAVAIKMPMLDYTRPASFGWREIELGRKAVMREWATLTRLASARGVLPAPRQMVVATNPLLEGRGSAHFARGETFLVQEWIDGETLDEVRQATFSRPASRVDELGRGVHDVTRELLLALWRISPELFADVAPRNFLRCRATGRIRIVDAGSVVREGALLWQPSEEDPTRLMTMRATTLCYLPSDYLDAFRRSERRAFRSTTMMCAVGKLIHELATNRHPVDGEDLDPASAHVARLPERTRELLRRLLEMEWESPREALVAWFGVELPGARDG
jgi:hypothetical protein